MEAPSKEEEKKEGELEEEEVKKAGDVRAGERYHHQGITVDIREVALYKTATGRPMIRVAYRILDRKFKTATAHFWMPRKDPVQPKIEEIVNFYKQVKGSLK